MYNNCVLSTDKFVLCISIGSGAGIEISKTLLEVEDTQMTLTNNKITIKDIYYKRQDRNLLFGKVTIDGINTEGSRLQLWNRSATGRNWNIINEHVDSKLVIRTDGMEVLNISPTTGRIVIGGTTLSRKDRLARTKTDLEKLLIRGNVKFDGYLEVVNDITIKGELDVENGLKSKPAWNKYIMVSNGISCRQVPVSGDMNIENTGELYINNDVISDRHIRSTANINMSKTNFNVDDSQIQYNSTTGRIGIKDIYATLTGANVLSGRLTINNNLISNSINTTALTTKNLISDTLKLNTNDLRLKDNDSGDVLISDGTKYRGVKISGDIQINSNGGVNINNNVIENDNISDTANIEVSKTLLAVEDRMILNNNTISIKPGKFLEQVDTTQMSISWPEGKISINDIYVKNNGDELKGSYTVDGLDVKDFLISSNSLRFKTNPAASMLLSDGFKMRQVQLSGDISVDKDGVVKIQRVEGFKNKDVEDDAGIEIKKTLLKAGRDITLDANTLNVDDNFLRNTGNVDIDGKLKIKEDYLELATNNESMILVADGTKFRPVNITGDIKMDRNGRFQIVSQTILTSDIQDKAITLDKLQDNLNLPVSQTTLQAGNNITLTDKGTLNVNFDNLVKIDNANIDKNLLIDSDDSDSLLTIHSKNAFTSKIMLTKQKINADGQDIGITNWQIGNELNTSNLFIKSSEQQRLINSMYFDGITGNIGIGNFSRTKLPTKTLDIDGSLKILNDSYFGGSVIFNDEVLCREKVTFNSIESIETRTQRLFLDYGEVTGDFKIGEDLIMPGTDGQMLVFRDGSYKPTSISGAITVNKFGAVNINPNSIGNNNILANADIEISKTLLEVEPLQMTLKNNKITIKDVYLKLYQNNVVDADITINNDFYCKGESELHSLEVKSDSIKVGKNIKGSLLVANGTKFNTVIPSGDMTMDEDAIFTMTDKTIMNKHININAEIDISKTTLRVNKDQMVLNGDTISIKDIYHKRQGDVIVNGEFSITKNHFKTKDNTAGGFLIGNGVRMETKLIRGDMLITSEGDATLQPQTVGVNNIKPNSIFNNMIDSAAGIEIVKTDLAVDTNYLTLNQNRIGIRTAAFVPYNNPHLKDTVRIDRTLNKNPGLTIVSDSFQYYPYIDMGKSTTNSWRMYLHPKTDAFNFWHKSMDKGLAMTMTTSGKFSFGMPLTNRWEYNVVERVEIYGNMKCVGNVMTDGFKYNGAGKNNVGSIMIADGTSYLPRQITGDIVLSVDGTAVVGAGKINNSHISSNAQDRIAIEKIDLQYGNMFEFETTTSPKTLNIKDIYLKTQGDAMSNTLQIINGFDDGTEARLDVFNQNPEKNPAILLGNNSASHWKMYTSTDDHHFILQNNINNVDDDSNIIFAVNATNGNIGLGFEEGFRNWPATWANEKLSIQGNLRVTDIIITKELNVTQDLTAGNMDVTQNISALGYISAKRFIRGNVLVSDTHAQIGGDISCNGGLTMIGSLNQGGNSITFGTNNSGEILINNGTQFVSQALTGVVSLDGTGNTTLNLTNSIVSEDITAGFVLPFSKVNIANAFKITLYVII